MTKFDEDPSAQSLEPIFFRNPQYSCFLFVGFELILPLLMKVRIMLLFLLAHSFEKDKLINR